MKGPTAETTEDVARIYPGPILVVAGPGTGKTHQLARRVKWLIKEHGVRKEEITVITFTGEAARNMKQRLSDKEREDVYLPPEEQPAEIRTMHSLGHAVISEKPRAVGLRKQFSVLTGKELREILFADAAQIVGVSRGDGSSAEECRRKGTCDPTDEIKCRVCERYRKILRECNTIDYDDQIFLACEVFRSEPDILASWQKKTRYLLVDEYQDINKAQYELIRLLIRGQEEGLYVVGDDDQSIYSWRGGTPEYVVNFEKHFASQARVFHLTECRRCPPHVLQAALAAVKKNNHKRRPKPDPTPISQEPSKVLEYHVPSDKREATEIAKGARQALTSEDVLVLLPGHRFAARIKKAMRAKRVGYECGHEVDESGLSRMNDAILWLNEPKRDFKLRLCIQRIVKNPDLKIPFEGSNKEGIEEKRERTLAKISHLWSEVGTRKAQKTLWEALGSAASDKPDLQFIAERLKDLQDQHAKKEKPSAFLEAVSRILRPWASIKAMEQEVEEWVEDSRARNVSGGGMLARILTMQAAKGLGADVVFVVGLDKDVFPSGFQDLEEQQRLFYVSMTRAKKELHLFHARVRSGRAGYTPPPDGKTQSALAPSPFLSYLPPEHVEKTDIWPYGRKRKKPVGSTENSL